eukprot:TRINITY_DN633_c0_g1_i1.p1 TRINITY_DN633_c0_g1~~TRINITY_DN633_c0_g1_i1.p1  ORF type:complete len:319 (+),score=96.80 TRINITY_DN633_c0_g1_i1:59-1015(+)
MTYVRSEVSYDSDSDSDSECPMNITLRQTGDSTTTATINRNGSVEDIKAAIAEEHAVEASQVRLIYKGRILKNHSTPPELGLEEGHTVDMVIDKPAVKASVVVPQKDLVALPGVSGVTVEKFKANPIISQMADDPMKLREFVLAANPGMEEAMAKDPHLAAVMNDPARLRDMCAMLKNPHLLNQATRDLDRQVTQLGAAGQHLMPYMNTDASPEATSTSASAPAPAGPLADAWGAPPPQPPQPALPGWALPPQPQEPQEPPQLPPSGMDFSRQLEQMGRMGFRDLRDNLTALHLFKGNMEFAVRFLKDGGLNKPIDHP